MDKNLDIDNIDIKILAELMKDAKTPYTEIAERVFVSGGTVHVRMKKLEKLGVVRGASLSVNFAQLGYDITAFIGIYLERSSMFEEVAQKLEHIPEVLNINYTTGEYSMFIRIICRDTAHLREVLHEKIQSVPGIFRTETMISLQERLHRPLQIGDL